ncbi:MAG TPA: COX15/CtaA family protein [Jiangellaceae bacterium]|nr:COX15/CtaA family protein [Jiangellaceae bacterium]
MTTAQTRTPQQPPAAGVWYRLPLPSERTIRGLAIASLVSQITIVVTGGAVRLTNSGLGCPEWPRCTPDSLTATPEMGIHGAVEFGNRLLTFVLGTIAALMLAAVWRTLRSDRPRRDLLVPAVVLFLGIPTQAFIGGVTVWSGLNPWVVMLHFMCSAVLIGVATVLVRRAQRPLGAVPPRLGSTWLARLGGANLVAAYLTVYLGTVVTGSGPHAGDPNSPRTGFDVASVTQFHVHAVTLLIGLTIGLYIAARAMGSPGRLARVALVLLAVELGQGLVGVTQYVLELPELLVGLHMLGAALLVAAAVDAWLASRWQPTHRAVEPVPTAGAV